MKKYQLLEYTAIKTSTDRWKLSKVYANVINPIKSKKGFESVLHWKVFDCYFWDDVSTTLTGKRYAKKDKNKETPIQNRVLIDYLNNLYQNLINKNDSISCSFLAFARMRPNNFVLVNFANRKTCLCTQHLNFVLKLKMLKVHNKTVPTNPEVPVKQTDA